MMGMSIFTPAPLGTSIETAEIDDDAVTRAKIGIPIGGEGIQLDFNAYSSVEQGTWAFTITNNVVDNIRFNNGGSDANADKVRYSLWMDEGDYTCVCLLQTGTAQAILGIDIEGTNKVSIDCYDNPGGLNIRKTDTFSITTSGIQTVDIYVNGRHASATNYLLYLTRLSFIRTA